MNNKIKKIIQQSIDIHVHVGPEIIPRKYTVDKLVAEEKGKIGGLVLKNHFYPTQPLINQINDSSELALFGGIVLNNSVGGLNYEAIYSSKIITDRRLMVWFPTINAKNFLSKNKYEIPPEWINDYRFISRTVKEVAPVEIIKNNTLNNESMRVLKEIKRCDSAMATGHISWMETLQLVDKAIEYGIKSIVITHPIYQTIAMPISVQKDLAKKGCFIEQSYSMYAIDKISISKIAEQIKAVGYNSVILSSDVGQIFSPSPSTALYRFARLLRKEGVSEHALYTMLVTNPKRLLNIN